MKKYIIFVSAISLLYVFFCSTFVYAEQLYVYDEYNAINYNNEMLLYKNNVLIDSINNAVILDIDDEYVVYNIDTNLYIYELLSYESTLISNKGYNALLYNDNVIYESDENHNYTCKNVIDMVVYNNCYKIYSYNIHNKKTSYIELNGENIYLNDIENDYLIYTSTHNRSSICDSICSYVNIYNFLNGDNQVLNKYDDLILSMSGNAYIDNNIVFFESVPAIELCNYSQIFYYDIEKEKFDMVSKTETNCFTSNSEILHLNDGYLIYKSNYGNYENDNEKNYVYSFDDNKYSSIDNICNNISSIIIDKNHIKCLIDGDIYEFKIDDETPYINTEQLYVALKEKPDKLISQLEYDDNLTKRENIRVKLLNKLIEIGEQFIKVELCDKFNNCVIENILVDVIDNDVSPPKIYCDNEIIIKSNSTFDINEYAYAIDNVDGKLNLVLKDEIDLTKKGKYKVLIESKDSSGNIGYKEITITIYDNLLINKVYLLVLTLSVIMIIIIYIFRFKKRNKI